VFGDDRAAKVRIVDTAPEVNAARALSYLREADWLLVPVKGPEAGSVLALPLLRVARRGPRRSPAGLRADHVQARRGESRRWLDELHRLAARTDARVFPPIGDLASVASFYTGGLKTQIADHHLGNPVIRSEYKQGSIKQDVRDHRLVPTEATSYHTPDLGVPKAIQHLPRLRQVLAGITDRYLATQQQDVLETDVDRGHLWRACAKRRSPRAATAHPVSSERREVAGCRAREWRDRHNADAVTASAASHSSNVVGAIRASGPANKVSPAISTLNGPPCASSGRA